MHTDARSAKKDVISTKPQKAMGAVRTFVREHKKLNILSFALASETGDRTQRYIRQRDCPPPSLAQSALDSVPR